MKKSLLFIVVVFGIGSTFAQNGNNFAQPTTVVAKRINDVGQVTKQMVSEFTYQSDGNIDVYDFPDHELQTYYSYSDEFYLTTEETFHNMHPLYCEWFNYSYENGRVKTISHLYDPQLDDNQYWIYTYYDDGRLKQKDYAGEAPYTFSQHWSYEYENDGRTLIESYCTDYNPPEMVLRSKTTYQYDEAYTLLSSQTDTYSNSGEITTRSLTSYYYNEGGSIEQEVTQTFTDGVWLNSQMVWYSYDGLERILEVTNGSWLEDGSDWFYSKRTVFDYNDDEMKMTVSFLKKNVNESDWTWDVFEGQTIFYEPELKWQQQALRYYYYDILFPSENINQFEFDMIHTVQPTYLSIESGDLTLVGVYPNPGKECVSINAGDNSVVRFYDLHGRMILAKPFDFQTNVNTDGWTKGIYLWEIWNGTRKEASGKWVKE